MAVDPRNGPRLELRDRVWSVPEGRSRPATTGPGREGLVDIERRAELGGPIHTKGVEILHGFLMETYAQRAPLSLSARVAFEQSYSEIEGDSASCGELVALLSSLSGLPLAQGMAITGSVDQVLAKAVYKPR